MNEEKQFARRVLVCGGRDYKDKSFLFLALDAVVVRLCLGSPVFCHGDAQGADRLAGEWAKSRGFECVAYPADWKKHGKKAGPIRNRQMLVEFKPDLVVAFSGGSGTADMIRQAKSAGVIVAEPSAGEVHGD